MVVMLAGASTWVVVRGELWKICNENCIRATDEEHLGIEAVEIHPSDLTPAWRKSHKRLRPS